MALSSDQPARRSITTAAVGLVTLGLLASCSANTSSSSQTTTMQPASASPDATTQASSASQTAQASSASGEIRSGCGTYCQSAGQYGAPGEGGQQAATIVSSGTVTIDADGYVPVTLTCNLPVQCSGALLVCLNDPTSSGQMAMFCGRSDLLMDGGATRTFGVPLPTPALAFLRSHGSAAVGVTADNNRVPPCEEIAGLAAACAKIPQTPGTAHIDGIIRLTSAELTVAPPTQPVASSGTPDTESASLQQLRQIAGDDRPFVSTQLADRWVPQLSSKRPGVVDDGVVWDNTLTLQEHLRLRQRYNAKLLLSGDWSTFDAPDIWVTIAPITFNDANSALQWCTIQGFDSDHCATKLVSTTHPVPGSFAHN